MKFCEGENPKTELLTSDLSYHWGKLIGKAHRVTKNYPIRKNINGKSSEYGYTDETHFFFDWCKDEFVKSKWQEMSVTLSQLPINRNHYGFIHTMSQGDNRTNKLSDVIERIFIFLSFKLYGKGEHIYEDSYKKAVISPIRNAIFDVYPQVCE